MLWLNRIYCVDLVSVLSHSHPLLDIWIVSSLGLLWLRSHTDRHLNSSWEGSMSVDGPQGLYKFTFFKKLPLFSHTTVPSYLSLEVYEHWFLTFLPTFGMANLCNPEHPWGCTVMPPCGSDLPPEMAEDAEHLLPSAYFSLPIQILCLFQFLNLIPEAGSCFSPG